MTKPIALEFEYSPSYVDGSALVWTPVVGGGIIGRGETRAEAICKAISNLSQTIVALATELKDTKP